MTIDFYPILEAFQAGGGVVTPLGRGNINDTFLVRQEGKDNCFVLQRINEKVFPKPERVVENFLHVSNQVSGCPDVISFLSLWPDLFQQGKGSPISETRPARYGGHRVFSTSFRQHE